MTWLASWLVDRMTGLLSFSYQGDTSLKKRKRKMRKCYRKSKQEYSKKNG
jgi:hypothetical protein